MNVRKVLRHFRKTARVGADVTSCCRLFEARFPFKRNRLRCVRCVNENRKKRKRLRWQAANHGCHFFDPVADPEFHNGGRTVEGEGSGEVAVPPPQKKN